MKAFKNIFSSLILQVITIVCGFVLPKIIISNFGSSVNGLINSITQFLSYIVLLESGVGPVVKASLYKPLSKNNKTEIANILYTTSRFFRKIAIVFVIYILVLSFIYPLFVKSNFDTFYTVQLIVIISISIFAEYYFGMTYRLFLQADQKNYIISYIQIITIILNTIITIILIRCNLSIHLVKLISSLIFIMRPLSVNMYFKKKYKFDESIKPKKIILKQKWDGLSQHFASVVHSNTDITIITIFLNVFEVSVYSVYNLVVSGLRKIIDSFASGIDSAFGEMMANNNVSLLYEKFRVYSFLYFSIISILFSTAIIMINPFIILYTRDIHDINYVRPLFAVLILLSEFMNSLKKPYAMLILGAGHFKQTKMGAWVEAFTNLFISIILVKKFGITGVAIGTLFGMSYRLFDYVFYCSKNIICIKLKESFKYIFVNLFFVIICIIVSNTIVFNITNFLSWITYLLIVFAIVCITIISLNIIFFQSDFSLLIKKIKKEK